MKKYFLICCFGFIVFLTLAVAVSWFSGATLVMAVGTRAEYGLILEKGNVVLTLRTYPIDLRSVNPEIGFFHGSWRITMGDPRVTNVFSFASVRIDHVEYGGGVRLLTTEERFTVGQFITIPLFVLSAFLVMRAVKGIRIVGRAGGLGSVGRV